jgi:site-specific recombinase XerD
VPLTLLSKHNGAFFRVAPLFRAAEGKRKVLAASPYGPHLMRQMMKRRLEDAGLPELFSPHSFRVTVVTDLLNQNVPLEDVQYLVSVDEVERILI